MPGSSVSCVSTTGPMCTDRTEVAPKTTPSAKARDTKRRATASHHEIRVEGGDRLVPWFRVPGGADPEVRAAA
jgi:hypothetical protein